MGWGCYKHGWDAGSEAWRQAATDLSNRKLEAAERGEEPITFGRDGEVCPSCWIELEGRHKESVEALKGECAMVEKAQDILTEALKADGEADYQEVLGELHELFDCYDGRVATSRSRLVIRRDKERRSSN